MTDLVGRYPFSTADGKSIPLDIVRPAGCLMLPVALTASAALTVPANIEAFTVFCTEDCILTFHATAPVASVPASGVLAVDSFYLPKGLIITLSPPIGKQLFSVIGVTAAGEFVAQFLESWSGLALQSQQARR